MSPTSQKVYLITGCSSGLGYCLAQAALATGAKVIATARNPQKNAQIYEDLKTAGATWATLDLTSPAFDRQIQEITTTHARIDVLINNAGTGGSVRPIEESSIPDAQRVFDTNLWGPVRTTQAILPTMRAQKSGCIVNISSASVFDGHPGIAFYAASKAALDTMTTSLASEVAPFGVKVVLVTPADMRTPFVGEGKVADILPPVGNAYRDGPVTVVQRFLHGMDGKQAIDPVKAAGRIVEAAEKSVADVGSGVVRLPIGVNSAQSMRGWAGDLLRQVERTEHVWASVDYPVGQ